MTPLSYSQLEKYSLDLFSDNKQDRQLARSQLIQETNSFKNIPLLTEDKKTPYPNWYRISNQLSAMMNQGEFPYAINSKKAALIHRIFLQLIVAPISHADFANSNEPCYLVTMAHTPKLALNHLSAQIDLLWNEGFSSNPSASKVEADKRLALVVGINYCHSLDNVANHRNRSYINEAEKKFNSSHVKVCAFNWSPVWIGNGVTVPLKKPKRLFRLLADAHPIMAQVIFKKVMASMTEVIPYQHIRNVIKNCPAATSFYMQMKHGVATRPSFLVSWDDDAVSLRTEDETGLFSQYDKLIAQNPKLRVASTGYYMVNQQVHFIEFASRIDLVARQAIAHTLPNGCYLPEPNLLVRINSWEDLKYKISFSHKIVGKGKGMEFLALMKNLGLMKGNVEGRVVLGKHGPILTSQPARAKASKHIPNILTPKRIDNAKNLASLRSFCQSVLNPQKGFAASVSRAMPTGAGLQTHTKKISKLYTAYDPIDYIKQFSEWKELYLAVIGTLTAVYNDKIKKEELQPNFTLRAKKILEHPNFKTTKEKDLAIFLETKFADIWKARTLITERVLSENDFLRVFIAAINTCSAVYAFLKSRIDETPFVFPKLLKNS